MDLTATGAGGLSSRVHLRGTVPMFHRLTLLILGLGQLVIAAFGISGSYLNLTSREGVVTRAFLIAVPLGIIASVVLTSEFGISGAAAGTVVMAIAWHLYVFGVRRREIDAPLSLFAAISRVWAGRR